jgi:hypothetical protein
MSVGSLALPSRRSTPWKKKYAHLGVSELRRLRQLEEENSRLKRLVADLSLDKHMLSEALQKKFEARPAPGTGAVVSRDVPGELCAGLSVSSVWSRVVVSEESGQGQTAQRLRIRDLAHARQRFGYVRIWVLLRREGWSVNRKRVRRWYRLEGLQLRMRLRRRKHIALHRGPAPVPVGPSEWWSMDFAHDTLSEGRPYRILTVVDHWSRSSPVLEAGFRCPVNSSVTCWTEYSVTDRARVPSPWIMAQNSNPGPWKIGPIGEE